MSNWQDARDTFDHLSEVPTGDFRFIALDVETANADSSSICQIGLACVQKDNEIQSFSMLVNPVSQFAPFNTQLHGIGPEMVTDALEFKDAFEQIYPLLANHHLVQHSSFDEKAIAAACRASKLRTPNLLWDDSVKIARRAWPELKGNGGHGLANLKKRLGLEFVHHDAGEDARAAAQVVLHAEIQLGLSFEELIAPKTKLRSTSMPVRRANPEGPFFGSVAVFSGELNMPRERAANLAANIGMAVRPKVTRTTTHLIVGDDFMPLFTDSGSLAEQESEMLPNNTAKNILILGEEEFRKLLRDAGQMV